MKKFVIVCLLVAIGAVSFIAKGESRSIREFCMQNPDLPECLPYVARLHRDPQMPLPSPEKNSTSAPQPYVDQGQPGSPSDFQPYYGRRNRDGFDLQFRFDNSVANRCNQFLQNLRQQSWRNVRILRCSGPSYVYSAWRDGQSITLLVSPNSGRIRKIIPAY